MAIYHCQAKTVSRGSGRSAVAAMAYRAGDRLTDERTGQTHDYSRRRGVLESGIIVPEDAPAWAQDREALWNAAEAAERRKDAKTAREYEIALPHELTDEQRAEAVREFCTWYSERHGVAVDYAIHAPHAHGDQRNYHAHVLTTTRRLEAEGFGAKTRELDSFQTSGPLLEEVRAQWEGIANRALERAGQEARIDRRSLEAQGIDREPTVHLGPAASAMLRRGESSELAERNQAAAERNAEREGLQAQYGAVSAEIIDLAAERARREQEAKWREQADRIWAQQEAERKAREAQRQEDARKVASEVKEPQRPEVIRAAAPPQAPQPAQQPEAVRVPPPPEPAKPFEAASGVDPRRAPEAQKQPEAARAAEPPRQAEPAPSSDAGKFWQTVRNAAMPADPNKPLSRDAGEIRLAYDLSTSGPGFIAGLKERGFGLAQVSAEDARQSLKEFEAAKAEPGTKYSPPLREGELVAVNKWGSVYTLTPRTLGNERAEIDKYLATIDRAALPDVARAKVEQTDEREQQWTALNEARRDLRRPLNAIEREVAGAFKARTASQFVEQLKEKNIHLAHVSEGDLARFKAENQSAKETLQWLRENDDHKFKDVRPVSHQVGELVAVTSRGKVVRLNPQLLDTKAMSLRAAVGGNCPGTVAEAQTAAAKGREDAAARRAEQQKERDKQRERDATLASAKHGVRAGVRAGQSAVRETGAALGRAAGPASLAADVLGSGLDRVAGLFESLLGGGPARQEDGRPGQEPPPSTPPRETPSPAAKAAAARQEHEEVVRQQAEDQAKQEQDAGNGRWSHLGRGRFAGWGREDERDNDYSRERERDPRRR